MRFLFKTAMIGYWRRTPFYAAATGETPENEGFGQHVCRHPEPLVLGKGVFIRCIMGVFVDDRVQLVLWYPVPHPEKSGQYPDITGGTGVFPVETAPTASKKRGGNPRSQKEKK